MRRVFTVLLNDFCIFMSLRGFYWACDSFSARCWNHFSFPRSGDFPTIRSLRDAPPEISSRKTLQKLLAI
jgi:hypothetical protein